MKNTHLSCSKLIQFEHTSLMVMDECEKCCIYNKDYVKKTHTLHHVYRVRMYWHNDSAWIL